MLVSLYATRVVLQSLGEVDYGIYNVVGGIVVMFAFLSRVLASASQRYFAFELGRNNKDRLKKIFSLTLILYVLVIIIILVAAELFGLWFLHNKATIPSERMIAATWILHFSIASFSITLLTTPFQADIIAHEQMDVYAYIGFLEAGLQLAIALALKYLLPYNDILITYGILVLLSSIISQSSYIVYALIKYEESHFRYYWDPQLAKEILSFSGWSLFGAIAGIARSYGINILINAFFNPAVNAARGIAYQINNAINQFANNFYTAVRPQLTKKYAKGDTEATFSLVFNSTKFTYYLLLFVAVPIMFFAAPILDFWLDVVPEHTLVFTKLVIIVALIDSLSNPLLTLAQATGKIKLYQIVVGILQFLNLPVSWFFLRLGCPAESTLVIAIVIAVITLFVRLFILRHMVGFPIRYYVFKVLVKISIPTILSSVFMYLLKATLSPSTNSIIILFVEIAIAVVITLGIILMTGLDNNEKKLLIGMIRAKLHLK